MRRAGPRPSPGWLVIAIVLATAAGCRGEVERGEPGPGVVDLEGRPVEPLDGDAVKVLLFTRTDCPISNRYAPQIRRLAERFAEVEIWLVYPGPSVTSDAIREHLVEYDYPCAAVRDPELALVRRTGATVTPEAAVFAAGAMVYRGRIDDRYVTLGRERPAPTTSDLRDAVEAALAGRVIEPATTTAVGCYIADLK